MREYVHNLKEWITREEAKHPMMNDWFEDVRVHSTPEERD
jgi:hypothetical protein